MPRKRGPGRPKKRGGARPGAGRPRLEGIGTEVVPVRLTPKHVAKVDRWADDNGAENRSDAIRQMIDAASPD